MQALEPDDHILQQRFRYLEWVTAALAASAQFAWTYAVVRYDWQIGLSFLLLALLCLISCYTPSNTLRRFIHLICQTALVCLASALGAHHFFYLILFVLAARSAVFLPRTQMLTIGAFILACHISSGIFAQYATHEIHIRRKPVPAYYRQVILEGDAYLYFAISLFTVVFLGHALIAERKSRNAEQELKNEVEQLAIKLDRGRIARDIHDGLGHSLTSSKIQLELALKALEENKADNALELIKRCQVSSTASLQELRQAVRTAQHGLLSLKQTVLLLVDELKQQTELAFKIHLDDISLSPKVQHQVFSIVKECITNIRKHASAKQVELTLTEKDGQVNLCLRDDGKGFDLKSTNSGFGLKGLQERAETIGASIKISTKTGKGTEIILSFPTEQSSRASPNSV